MHSGHGRASRGLCVRARLTFVDLGIGEVGHGVEGRRRKQRRTRRREGGNEGQTEVVGAVVVLSRSLAVFTDIDPYSSASPGRCVELPVHYIPIRTDGK